MVETHFQKELQELKENLLRMAALVEEAIHNAVESLVKRDSELAQKTFEIEDRINNLENAIDETCL
jgi:phosphate transport system protein